MQYRYCENKPKNEKTMNKTKRALVTALRRIWLKMYFSIYVTS